MTTIQTHVSASATSIIAECTQNVQKKVLSGKKKNGKTLCVKYADKANPAHVNLECSTKGGSSLEVVGKLDEKRAKFICVVKKPCTPPPNAKLEIVDETCSCEYEETCPSDHPVQMGEKCFKEPDNGPREIAEQEPAKKECPKGSSESQDEKGDKICQKTLSSCDMVDREMAFGPSKEEQDFLLLTGVCGPRIKNNTKIMLEMMTSAINPLLFLQEGRTQQKFVGPVPTRHLKKRIQCISTCAAAFAKFSECYADDDPKICQGGGAGTTASGGLAQILKLVPPRRSKTGPHKDIFFTCTSHDSTTVPDSRGCGIPKEGQFPLYGVLMPLPCKSMYDSDLTMSEDTVSSKAKQMEDYTHGLSKAKMSHHNLKDLPSLSCSVAWCQNAQMKHKDAVTNKFLDDNKYYTYDACLKVCRTKDPLWSEGDMKPSPLDDESLKRLNAECLTGKFCEGWKDPRLK